MVDEVRQVVFGSIDLNLPDFTRLVAVEDINFNQLTQTLIFNA